MHQSEYGSNIVGYKLVSYPVVRLIHTYPPSQVRLSAPQSHREPTKDKAPFRTLECFVGAEEIREYLAAKLAAKRKRAREVTVIHP